MRNTFGRDSAGVRLLFLTSVVHLEVVELQLLVAHFAGVDGNVHVLGNVTKTRESLNQSENEKTNGKLTLSPFEGFQCGGLAVVHGVRGCDRHREAVDDLAEVDGGLAGEVAAELEAKTRKHCFRIGSSFESFSQKQRESSTNQFPESKSVTFPHFTTVSRHQILYEPKQNVFTVC
jgi:hypothetical protein